MAHILDNMIWNALATGNRNIAVVNNGVGRYLPDIAPFAAIKEPGESNLEKLYEFISTGDTIALSSLEKINYDDRKWQVNQSMDVTQMLYLHPVRAFCTESSGLITPLTDIHIPQMLNLTSITKPGPFLEHTILFGNYFGIFKDEKLIAMTGQRMHPVPYMEVSAVCTHPDHQGKGYAKTLMLHVMKIILDNSFVPFLHVLTSNITAIRLYESIGFQKRKQLFIDVLERL